MVEPHKHCLNCGISIPPDQNFCSEKCKEEWMAAIRKRRKIILYQTIALIILIFVIFIIPQILR